PRLAAAGLHAPPARTAGVPVAPPARVVLEAAPRPRALRVRPHVDRRAAARRRGARGRELRDRPRVRGRAARLSPRVAELARRRLQPRLRARLPERRRDLLDAPVATRRRAGAVVLAGVRLRDDGGRVLVRVEPDAAEEEPGRGRAVAREGAARARPAGDAARRAARPAADLQQGHAGGQGAALRRDRLAGALAAGRPRDARERELRPRA